jgi:site-specific recombinase XerD
MIEKFVRKPHVAARLRASLFGAELEAIAAAHQHLGYRPSTIRGHLEVAGHVAYWVARERLDLRAFGESAIQRFAERHLPRCRCPVPRGKRPDLSGVAPHLLRELRAAGRIPPPRIAPATEADRILAAFVRHLEADRGASAATRDRYAREVRFLLRRACGPGGFDVSRLTPTALRSFIVGRAARWSPRTARRAGTAVRSFLRFLHLCGVCDAKAVQAIPAVRDSRRSALPFALSAAQLRHLLDAIDRSRPVGLRDHAMLLCLARLGLRAKEAAELSFDDVDWRAGTITIATSKARRAGVLPLPDQVGRAIARYVRFGRPATSARRIFVRHFFPVGGVLTSAVVTRTAGRAFRRAGLVVPSAGAHTLRHTAATAMVHAGASLKAVADVLRHRSLDTTAIYTHVDLVRLRAVALAWPEVRP